MEQFDNNRIRHMVEENLLRKHIGYKTGALSKFFSIPFVTM